MVANRLLNVTEADYEDSNKNQHLAENVKIKFFPPVYVQRYNTVLSVLTSSQYHGKIHKVIDFGCAELNFAIHLKNTDGIQEIYCIDVDKPLLENSQTKVAPLHCDYLSIRPEPLTIHVCEGSIAHNDNKLANSDAVICIELIEHLYPDDLEAFPYNVFGFIKPQVAIVTTPNADFNVLFQLNGFRHFDHKFEWTRAQFQDWATNIVLRYPDYEVSFHGIGAGPGGTEHLGMCSQMAVFHRHTQLHSERPEGVDGLLKTVVSHKYSYSVDNRSDEEKMLAEAEYYIRLYSSRYEDLSEEIPLEKLMFSVEKFRISVDILRGILEDANWAIADRENGPVVLIPPQSTFSMNSDVDLDDFLDNDYRQRGNDDDWDTLESGAPSSGYLFDSYMETDPQNHEEEENWDDEMHDAGHSSSSNLNSENPPNSEPHVSENVDLISDGQWTMEDLNNQSPLLDAPQHQQGAAVDSSGNETELPSNSFLIGLDTTDINYLNISDDTFNSSERNMSSPLPLSDLSENLHSLETDNDQSLSTNKNPILPNNNFGGSLQSKEINTGTCVENNQILKLEGQAANHTHPISSSSQLRDTENEVQYDNNCSMLDNKEPSTEFQTRFNQPGIENDSKNGVIQSNLHLPSNDRTAVLSKDSQPLSLESAITDNVDSHSAHTKTSSISTAEATFLLSHEQSLLIENKDLLPNASQLSGNKEFPNDSREGTRQRIDSVSQGCSASLLLTDQSMLDSDDHYDLCSMYLQPSAAGNDSLYSKKEISHLSIEDFSSATNESYKNLDVSGDNINSSYQKCGTDFINTRKLGTDGIKSQESMSFKSISDCSLDLQPKYTSSPQVVTSVHKIQAPSENRTQLFLDKPSIHDHKCTSMLQIVPQTIRTININNTNDENTYQSNIKKETKEALEIQSSDPKMNLLFTNDLSTRDQNNLHKESSLEGKENKNAILNWPELKIVENISPSTSQLSLQSSSDISLSTATSTGSSNVDKWYAAETNPMYQRDPIALKGGNDTADNPNDETMSDSDATISGSDKGKDIETTKNMAKILPLAAVETKSSVTDKKLRTIQDTGKNVDGDVDTHQTFPGKVQNSDQVASFLLTVKKEDVDAHRLSLDSSEFSSDSTPSGFLKQIENDYLPNFDILDLRTSERNQLPSAMSNCRSTPSNEVSTSYNVSKITKERGQLKYEFDPVKGFENVEAKPFSPESLDTPPDSWSPEIMDSGYPNSASVQDITPEFELSSIANDRISDSDSSSVGEVPVPGFYEFVEVENGDLANNNRDDEGNNVIAFEANDLDDLQPLIDVLENDMENENDIYVLQNGFPLWLLRILEMANPIDLEGMGGLQAQQYPAPLDQAGGDAPNVNADNDEGFDSSSSEDESDIEADEADDATTISSDETEDHSAENLRRDWRAGGDP